MMFRRFVTFLIVVLGLAFATGPMSLAASTGGCDTSMMRNAVEHVPCQKNKTHDPAPCTMAGASLSHHVAFDAQDADAPLAMMFERPVDLRIHETQQPIGTIAVPPFEPPRGNA